ncbi:hypothetical protein [Amphritea japonica]|uniref:Uncharacterized protein n=1 Tax=Amphritea japonica ATCC BAA-1530 TaxID=1278309 RepID=A0A7R6P487_9GAMM|nr:hypothetical protein [Amphritea japonica]BBB25659.1 hypothetical protein AMJAP_1062 [Amphritea japonica ATCC BAA-1530]
MFEAHLTYAASPLADYAQDDPCIKLNTPASCWHAIHQCNLRYWITRGKRQSQTLLFLYIEFKKTDNSHGYKLIELLETESSAIKLSVKEAQKIINSTLLGTTLDRLKTEQWCQSL